MFKFAKKALNRVGDVIDNKTGKVVGAVAGAVAVASTNTYAVGIDLSTLTAAVDFSTVITAILAVAAIMVGVYVAWKAAKMVIAAVKGL